MTVIYQKPNKNYLIDIPKRYEVQWWIFGQWSHWTWHRYKWGAQFEVFICGLSRMRILDHDEQA